ncbi:MAG: hypothetical protein GY793_03415 [Proteobacteria bacterium]|nr:hypothetical protein [Pseudomonadota bacterium]
MLNLLNRSAQIQTLQIKAYEDDNEWTLIHGCVVLVYKYANSGELTYKPGGNTLKRQGYMLKTENEMPQGQDTMEELPTDAELEAKCPQYKV